MAQAPGHVRVVAVVEPLVHPQRLLVQLPRSHNLTQLMQGDGELAQAHGYVGVVVVVEPLAYGQRLLV